MQKYAEFQQLKKEALQRAAEYEEREAFEMAYISIWRVLEKGLRLFADASLQNSLIEQVTAWKEYLDGRSKKKPEAIRNFNVSYTHHSIPPVQLVEEILGPIPKVSTVMDSNKKWRRRRNQIAHDAMPFAKIQTYEGYKHELLEAIDEFHKSATIFSKNKSQIR